MRIGGRTDWSGCWPLLENNWPAGRQMDQSQRVILIRVIMIGELYIIADLLIWSDRMEELVEAREQKKWDIQCTLVH